MNLTATMFLDKTGFAGPLAQLQGQLAAALAQLQGFSAAETLAGSAGAAAAPGIVAQGAATAASAAGATAATAALAGFAGANASAATSATVTTGALVGMSLAADGAEDTILETAAGAEILSNRLALLTGRVLSTTGALLGLRAASGGGGLLLLPGRGAAQPPPLPNIGPAAASGAAGVSALGGGLTRILVPLAAVVTGVGLLTTGIITMRSAINEAAQMEDFETSFTTLLGSVDAAKNRMADLAQFAETTPFELPEISAASKLLQAFTGDALAVGAGLRLVGDNAAALNPDKLQETALWMGRLFSAMQGGTPMGEPLQNLTQLGLITPQIRAQLLSLQGDEMSTAEIMEVLNQAFARNAGAMERLSVTYTGRLSTMRDAWAATKREFGTPIRDALKPVIVDLTKFFEEMRPKAQAWGQAVADGITVARQALADDQFGSLAGAALKIGFSEAINFLGTATLAAFDAQLSVISQQSYWEGVGNAIAAVLEGVGASLLGIFSQPIAMWNAAIETATEKAAAIALKTNPVNMVAGAFGHGAEVEAQSFEENLAEWQKLMQDITTAAVNDAGSNAAKAADKLGKAGVDFYDEFAKNLADSPEAIDVTGMKEDFKERWQGFLDRASAEAAASQPPEVVGGVGAIGEGTVGSKSEGKGSAPETDRLRSIGIVVGEAFGGVALRGPMEQTAANTGKTVDTLQKLLAGPSGPGFGAPKVGPNSIVELLGGGVGSAGAVDGPARAAAFVGSNGGPALEHARRTADNTAKMVDKFTELIDRISNLQTEAAWG